MPQNMILATLIALGVTLSVSGQAEAAQKRSQSIEHSASQKLKAPTGRSRAVPGDTCLGADACNELIAECAGSGLDFKPMEETPDGVPTHGWCVKPKKK